MSSSDFFAGSDTRLRNFIRQYSGYLKQNNLDNLQLTQSSHPAQMYNLGQQPNDLLMNEQFRRGSDVRSLIQQLMTKKQMTNPAAMATNLNLNPARPVLVNTQQRIFQQVVNLLLQINQIKESIQKQKDLTLQMETQRDNIINKGNSKSRNKKPTDFEMQSIISKLKSKQGDELKISMAQLERFASQNQQLQKNINRLKLKSRGNLKQVLQEQRQKYKALKKKLDDKNNQQTPVSLGITNTEVLQQIKKLQSDIERLQIGIQDGSSIGTEIKRLNQENQRLKEKTMSFIKQQEQGLQQTKEEEEERRRLQDYIRTEQQNKIYFFQDLKVFKNEYESLKEQNQELKRRLKSNQSSQHSRKFESPPIQSQNKFYTDTYKQYGEGEQKFVKYHDLMSQMNTVMK